MKNSIDQPTPPTSDPSIAKSQEVHQADELSFDEEITSLFTRTEGKALVEVETVEQLLNKCALISFVQGRNAKSTSTFVETIEIIIH